MTSLSFYQKLAGQRRVTTRATAQLAGLSLATASMALQRLATEGLVTRVKNGAWLVGSAASKPGALVAAAAHPYEAYLSGWSALRYHNCIEQFSEAHFGVTLGRPAEVDVAGTRVRLHHITPALFAGYTYEPSADGLVASPEKALFDLAYFATMNRSRIKGRLPETDLKGFHWSQIQGWLRRIPTASIRTVVGRILRELRTQHATVADE